MEAALPDRAEVELAPVIPIWSKRGRAPSCFICVKAVFDDEGTTVCSLVGDVIDTENITALDCTTYEEDPDAR